jgi:protein-tyrosine phosphatase
MKYAIAFGLLGVYLIALGCILEGAGWLLLWPGISFLVVAGAYSGLGPRVYGKRSDGRMAWWAVLVLLPYLLLSWTVWHIQRRVSKEPCCNEVAPGLWIGRRVYANELPREVSLIVDLTVEFSEPHRVRKGRSYICLPVLDAFVPSEHELRELAERVAAWTGTVYIHCASGHGRSAMVAAAVILMRGLAADAKQAERMVRQARPAVRLKPAQRRLLDRIRAAQAPGGGV